MTRGLLVCLLLSACEPDPTPSPEAPEPTAESPSEAPASEEPLRLNVPPEQIHGARREAAGLYRMPRALRAQTLAARRAEPAPSYAELRRDADAHARERVSFTGRVGLVRSAGPRLWIMALHARREGDEWRDPLYVLATIPPMLPHNGGAIATIDAWVVGPRTIGQHALPLVVAYYIERVDEPSDEPAPDGEPDVEDGE